MVDNPADLVQPRGEDPRLYPAPHHSGREIPQGRQSADHLSQYQGRQNQQHRPMIKNALQHRRHRPPRRRRRPAYRSGAAGLGPGFLRDRRDRGRRPGSRRGPASGQGPSEGADGRHRRGIEAYRNSPTPNVIILESESRARRHPRRARQARRGLRRRHAGHRHRPAQRRRALSRADAPRRQRLSDRAASAPSTSSARSAACSPRRTPSRSAASSPWSAPRAASAPPPSRTTSPGRSPATSSLDAVVVDLDLAFGTAGLDFNQDPPQGIADAVFAPDRLDTAFSIACCRNAPTISACSRRRRRSTASTISAAKPSSRSSMPLRATVPVRRARRAAPLDRLGQRTLVGADEILIVAAPDLANLRNAKNLIDFLQRRAAQRPPAAASASTRSACRSGPRSSRAISPRRSTTSRRRSSRSSRSCSAPPPTTAR